MKTAAPVFAPGRPFRIRDRVAPFPADTDYFGRMDQQVMLNFRVDDLDAMLEDLRAVFSAGAGGD